MGQDNQLPNNFIQEQIQRDLKEGCTDIVVTRFPPEPNGYLHLGHAKAICLNFSLAAQFNGRCHLRLDDTNPMKEDNKYVDAIKNDIHWLGFDWGQHLYYASDNFEQLYEMAINLIKSGYAYVDDLSAEEIRKYRGSLTEPGSESPNRNRSPDENISLFTQMRNGEFANGEKVLRAKIDMASGNMNLRDPVLFRIIHSDHPRTGNAWKIYPTYDFAHGQSDAIENITHSLCTLEFEDHRPLYEWLLDKLSTPSRPKQYEFARLNISHTVLSKRNLMNLVDNNYVTGWDDPRMPTLSGLRRRGVPPEAIKNFVSKLSISKREGIVELAAFDFEIREYLNQHAERRLAVLNPLKVVIENYPTDKTEQVKAANNPKDESAGQRSLTFGREIYIERDDFMEDPPRKFFRLGPGREVRLRFAYYIKCEKVIRDKTGNILELRCTYDPETKSGTPSDGRKVKGVIHWVSVLDALDAEVRVYNPLFLADSPGKNGNIEDEINPSSLEIISGCKVEPSLAKATGQKAFQFERNGYFCVDADSEPERLVFNRTIALRDSWTKAMK